MTCRSPVRDVIIYNTGNSVVTVTNVYLDPTTTPEFELTPLSTPYTLAGGSGDGGIGWSIRFEVVP